MLTKGEIRNMNRKDIFISVFKSKIGYSFTYKDLTEFETVINFYEQQCKKQQEVIDKANKKLNNFIDCCKAEKLESGSDYIHHQYWDMFERFNKQIKDILKEVSE